MERDADYLLRFDAEKRPEAEILVAKAFAEIDRGWRANPKVDAKRRVRARRMRDRIPDHSRDLVVSIVAQWLSAREAPAAAAKAREAAEGVKALIQQIEDARERIFKLDRALRYSDITAAGAEAQGLAQLMSGSLAEAARALSQTGAWAGDLVDLIPANAKGPHGVVGALTDASVNEKLLSDLARVWLDCGLSLSGGNDGDGLDILTQVIIGDLGEAEKALSVCRRETRNPLVNKNLPPELPKLR